MCSHHGDNRSANGGRHRERAAKGERGIASKTGQNRVARPPRWYWFLRQRCWPRTSRPRPTATRRPRSAPLPDELPYAATLEPMADENATAALTGASNLLKLQSSPPSGPVGLVRRALADRDRLYGALGRPVVLRRRGPHHHRRRGPGRSRAGRPADGTAGQGSGQGLDQDRSRSILQVRDRAADRHPGVGPAAAGDRPGAARPRSRQAGAVGHHPQRRGRDGGADERPGLSAGQGAVARRGGRPCRPDHGPDRGAGPRAQGRLRPGHGGGRGDGPGELHPEPRALRHRPGLLAAAGPGPAQGPGRSRRVQQRPRHHRGPGRRAGQCPGDDRGAGAAAALHRLRRQLRDQLRRRA